MGASQVWLSPQDMGQTLETPELPPWSPPKEDDAPTAIMGTHTQTARSPAGAHGGDRN